MAEKDFEPLVESFVSGLSHVHPDGSLTLESFDPVHADSPVGSVTVGSAFAMLKLTVLLPV